MVADRELLERKSKRVDLMDVGCGERGNEGASAGDRDNKPRLFEFFEGVSNRPPAGAESFRQLGFDEPVTWGDGAGHDELADRCGDGVAEVDRHNDQGTLVGFCLGGRVVGERHAKNSTLFRLTVNC